MTWEKENLVTLKDGSDIYKCSKCGHKQKYFGLGGRSNECPKCKPEDIIGCWHNVNNPHMTKCVHCYHQMIEVLKKGHPNSKYWPLKRDNEILIACPNNCGEITGINRN